MGTELILKLLSSQIPQYWKLIQHCAVKADQVSSVQAYSNELLHALLSDKSRCFVRVDKESREILTMWTVRILVNKITGKGDCHVQWLYSFKTISPTFVEQFAEFLKSFARQEKCDYISFESANKRVWEIAKMANCKEQSRRFVYDLGGHDGK